MTEIRFRSDVTVLLDDFMGDDAKVVRMAKASIRKTGADMDEAARYGFIDFLARERHGVPFEHIAMTFYVEAPVMVWRQLDKHRHTSSSQASGRYTEAAPVFYVPTADRPLVQVGKAGDYRFEHGTEGQHAYTTAALRLSATQAHAAYRRLLGEGVAREVARAVLPVTLYSEGYITINGRSLMHLLSLRTTGRENAAIVSHAQREVEMVAEGMEAHFAAHYPTVYAAFEKHGRVAP